MLIEIKDYFLVIYPVFYAIRLSMHAFESIIQQKIIFLRKPLQTKQLQHMKIIKKAALALLISFSIFCFCYLNMQKSVVAESNHAVMEYELEERSESEMYFPDTKFVMKLVKIAKSISETF